MPMRLSLFCCLCLCMLLFASCGSTTKATIRNRADGTSTTVSITTNNPSTINVDPNVKLN